MRERAPQGGTEGCVSDREERDQLVLDAVAGRRPNAKGNVRANCPFCEMVVQKSDRKQCLSVNLGSGFFKCYRCDTKGKIDDSVMPYDFATLKPKAPGEEEAKPVNLPEGFVPLWKPEERKSMVCRPAMKYLRTRVDEQTIELARIGACVRGPFQGRVVVPIYKAGKLAGYVGRVWKSKCRPDERKYLYNPGFDRANVLYNEDSLYVTTDKPVLVVEGVFDTFPFFPDAVALLGKASPQQIEMLLKARRPIAIVLDGDAHREASALAMALRLEGKDAVALQLPAGVDPDECPEEVWQRATAAFAA